MKKLLLAISLIVYTAGLISCSKQKNVSDNDKVEKIPVSEVCSTIDSALEQIKDTEYENLDIKAERISFPDIETVCTFDYVNKTDLTAQEMHDIYKQAFDAFYDGNDDIYDISYAVTSSGTADDSADYPKNYPLYADIEEQLLSGKYELMQILASNSDIYISVLQGGLQGVNCGKASDYDEVHSPLLYFLSDNINDNEIVAVYSDTESEDKYNLLNGEMSIKDAVDYAENFFNTEFAFGNQQLKIKVFMVYVVDMGDGVYNYCMAASRSYDGVIFDAQRSLSNAGMTYSSDDNNYAQPAGCISMIESDKIDSFTQCYTNIDITETFSADEIISLHQAMQTVSESFSGYTVLNVLSIDFVYAHYYDEEAEKSIARPQWKFSMINTADNYAYYAYVDAIDGKMHYFTDNSPDLTYFEVE